MRALLVALICVVSMSGCTSSSDELTPSASTAQTTSGAPTDPAAATIAWVDGECAVEAALQENLLPPQLAVPPTEADRPAAVAFLTAARDRFQSAKTILDELGKAPVPEGDDLVMAQSEVVKEMAAKLDEYLTNATKFPAPEFGAPFRLALVDLNHFTVGDLSLSDLTEKYPALAEAYKAAPRC
jgi:hypothetical protein